MDAPAIREELRDMARRLGTSGYYVMLPNLYYRSGVMELGPMPADPESPERKRMFQLMASINIPAGDGGYQALLAYADGQSAARKDIVGSVGYCMSGQYAINAATHFPGRVKAAASIYGVQLATDRPDSPHLAGQKTRAELYFGCAETDVYAPMEIVEKVKLQMKADGANAEVEIYPGTHHGFAFPKRPVYDKTPLSVTGNGCWHCIAATSRIDPWRNALSHHRLSGVRPDRHFDRPDRDPLVCAGLYRRHRAGLALRPRADQE